MGVSKAHSFKAGSDGNSMSTSNVVCGGWRDSKARVWIISVCGVSDVISFYNGSIGNGSRIGALWEGGIYSSAIVEVCIVSCCISSFSDFDEVFLALCWYRTPNSSVSESIVAGSSRSSETVSPCVSGENGRSETRKVGGVSSTFSKSRLWFFLWSCMDVRVGL